jgi:hypothetical protein
MRASLFTLFLSLASLALALAPVASAGGLVSPVGARPTRRRAASAVAGD